MKTLDISFEDGRKLTLSVIGKKSDTTNFYGVKEILVSNLKAAGAEIAAITANTEHIIWDKVCNEFQLPCN